MAGSGLDFKWISRVMADLVEKNNINYSDEQIKQISPYILLKWLSFNPDFLPIIAKYQRLLSSMKKTVLNTRETLQFLYFNLPQQPFRYIPYISKGKKK